MGCNKCNNTVPNCGCKTKSSCGCAIKTGTECVTLNIDLECVDFARGGTLQDALTAIDEYLCELLDLIQSAGSFVIQNVGGEAEVYKGISPSGIRQFRTLKSDSLNISTVGDNITIEISDLGIEQYIVNNLYTGSEELGTLGKPFKTIANAITAFVGNGTADAPENQNATIIVQKGNTYTFTGNLSYRNLNVILEEGAVVNHTPSTGSWFVDYDTLTNIKSTLNLTVKEGAVLTLNQKGFRNIGSTGGAAQVKIIKINGSGKIQLSGARASGYTLFESNYSNASGYGMPAFQNFIVEGTELVSVEKDFWNMGRESETIFTNCKIRHSYKGSTINIASESFDQVGGNITCTNCEFYINGTERTNCFTLEKETSFGCTLTLDKCSLLFPDTITNFFYRYGTNNPTVICQYTSTTNSIPLTNIFNTASGIWTGIYFRYNIFSGGRLANDTGGGVVSADLTNANTVSTSNLIGGRNIATLSRYANRSAATSALTTGSLFLNTNSDNVDNTTWFVDIVI
jgi:hypothetical protein